HQHRDSNGCGPRPHQQTRTTPIVVGLREWHLRYHWQVQHLEHFVSAPERRVEEIEQRGDEKAQSETGGGLDGVAFQSWNARRICRWPGGIEDAELFAHLSLLELGRHRGLFALGQEVFVGLLLRLVVTRERNPL